MHDGALNDPLKTQSGLGIDFLGARYLRRVVFDKVAQRLAKIIQIGRTSSQHLSSGGVVQKGQQQVLNRDEFVALLPSLNEGHVQAHF